MDIFEAVRVGNLDMVRTYLKYGGDVNNTINTGSTLSMIAATYGQTEVLKILIGAGADINAVSYDGKNALTYSMMPMSNMETVKLLIDSGADVNASYSRSSSAGSTPLMFAAEMGRSEIVELLIASGADIHARDNGGRTALDRASEVSHAGPVVKILREAGAE